MSEDMQDDLLATLKEIRDEISHLNEAADYLNSEVRECQKALGDLVGEVAGLRRAVEAKG